MRLPSMTTPEPVTSCGVALVQGLYGSGRRSVEKILTTEFSTAVEAGMAACIFQRRQQQSKQSTRTGIHEDPSYGRRRAGLARGRRLDLFLSLGHQARACQHRAGGRTKDLHGFPFWLTVLIVVAAAGIYTLPSRKNARILTVLQRPHRPANSMP
jgi:hypothetical protein